MLKVLCDLYITENNTFVGYTHCRVCQLLNSILSSTEVIPTEEDREKIVEHSNARLVPYIQRYQGVYDWVNSKGTDSLQYVGIVGLDTSLRSLTTRPITDAPELFVYFYEAIIIAGEPAHSLCVHDRGLGFHSLFAQRTLLSVQKSTIVAKYTLLPIESEFSNFVVDINLVGYFLENAGTLVCISPDNFSENKLNAEHYHLYIKEKAFKELKAVMTFFTICKIEEVYVHLTDDFQRDTKDVCNMVGGTSLSHLSAIRSICATNPYFSVGNDALMVTCDNWNTTLHFDLAGNLEGLVLEVNSTLFI